MEAIAVTEIKNLQEVLDKLQERLDEEPNVYSADDKALEHELVIGKILQEEIKGYQPRFAALEKHLEQSKKHPLPQVVQGLKLQIDTIRLAYEKTVEEADERQNWIHDAVKNRQDFSIQLVNCEKWMKKSQRELDNGNEIYTDEVPDLQTKIKDLEVESEGKKHMFDTLARKCNKLIKNYSEEEGTILRNRFDRMKAGFCKIQDLIKRRQLLCEKWVNFSGDLIDFQAKLKFLRQKVQQPGITEGEINEISNDLENLPKGMGTWIRKKKQMDDLMAIADVVIKDRATQRILHFGTELQALQNMFDSVSTDASKKQKYLNRLYQLCDEFDHRTENLLGHFLILKNKLQNISVESSFKDVTDLTHIMQEVRETMLSMETECDQLQELGTLLQNADTSHGRNAAESMHQVSRAWDQLEELYDDKYQIYLFLANYRNAKIQEHRRLNKTKAQLILCRDVSSKRYSVHEKLATIKDLIIGLKEGKQKRDQAANKSNKLKAALPRDVHTEIEKQRKLADKEFNNLVKHLELTQNTLEEYVYRLEKYNYIYEELSQWIKAMELKLRNEDNLKSELPGKTQHFRNLNEDIKRHRTKVEALHNEALEISNATGVGRTAKYATQLLTRYEALANNVNTEEENYFLSSFKQMRSRDFKDLISKGDYASYENRVFLAGACNIGKSSLASILIGDQIPKKWNSTDGLVIHFGRNGIHLEDRKMIPLAESDSNILKKLLLGKPNLEAKKTQKRESKPSNIIHNRVQAIEATIRNGSSVQVDDQIVTRPTADEKAYDNKLVTTRSYKQQVRKSIELEKGAIPKLPIPHIAPQHAQTAYSFQSSVLQEIRDGTYKIRIAPSDLIDFGGQRSFDMTHQLFIQQRGTFVLMFDGRYGLFSRLKEYPQDNITAKDILVHWVNSILVYCGEGGDKMPMILFAATHSDMFCADAIAAGKLKYITQLTKLFQTHNQRNHILYDRLFFINATNHVDPEIELLKDALVDIAFQQPTWGQRMPVAWVPLELQISEWRTEGVNIIAKEEIEKFNRSDPEFMLNKVNLGRFLKLQHSLGKIMYIDQPGLRHFIVIQPTAMVNILRSFVTDKIFWPEDVGLRDILNGMVNSGIVEKKQLLSLWSQPKFEQLLPTTEHKEYIIQVLVHLDILVEPKHDNKKETECERFLVPCLVNSTLPAQVLNYDEQKTICLAYELTESIITSALSFKLIGAAVAIWPLKEVDGRNCLYYQSAIMKVDENNELLIKIKGQTIVIYLSNIFSKYLISPDVAASIQECLTLALERVLTFYHECFGRSTAKLDLLTRVAMNVGEMCKRSLCLLPLVDARMKQSWICVKGQKHETKYSLYWDFNRHTRTCHTECKGLPKEALSLTPTDQHLMRLAKQLDIQEFDKFFIYLGMTRADLEEVEYRFTQNDILCRKLMALNKWKKKNDKVRLQDLLDGLKRIDRTHYLCQIVREETNMFGITNDRLQNPPSDEFLEELSHRLGNCVIQLGIELGLSFDSIEETMYRFPKDMYGQIYEILKKWKRQQIVKPTVRRLMMALQIVQCGGLSFLQSQYK